MGIIQRQKMMFFLDKLEEKIVHWLAKFPDAYTLGW